MLKEGEFCVECGTGVVERTATTSTLRLPNDYPLNKECGFCAERSKQSIKKFAANIVKSANDRVFSKLMEAVNE